MKALFITLFYSISLYATVSAEPSSENNGRLVIERFKEPFNIYELRADWEFYWQKHYFSSDFEAGLPEKPQYLRLPGEWNSLITGSSLLPSMGYATLRLKVVLPEPGIYRVYSDPQVIALRFFINGRRVFTSGRVGTKPENSEAVFSERPDFTFKTEKREIEIIIHASNFEHRRSHLSVPFYIGSPDNISGFITSGIALASAHTGALVVLGIFLIFFFLNSRHEVYMLYIGLLSFITGIHFLHFPERIINMMIPDMSMIMSLRLEYSLFALLMLFGVMALREFFEVKNRFTSVLVYLSLIFLLVSISTEMSVFTYLLPVYLVFVNVIYLYAIFHSYRLYRQAYVEMRLMMIGLAASFIGTSIDMIVFQFFSEMILPFKFAGMTSVIMYLMVALAVSYRYSMSLRHSDRLAVQLKELNRDLEKKVRKRTEHLIKLNHEKTRFLNLVAHDLKTPLAAIARISESILRRENSESNRWVAAIRDINESAESMIAMVKSFLTRKPADLHSEKEDEPAGSAEQQVYIFDELKELISEVEKLYSEQSFKLSADRMNAGVALPQQSRGATRQILQNLLVNAAEHTDKHSEITVQFNARKSDEVVSICVCSAGNEIDPEFRPERLQFLSEPPGGHHGLWLVAHLAYSLKADLDYHYKNGRNCFILRLPPGN